MLDAAETADCVENAGLMQQHFQLLLLIAGRIHIEDDASLPVPLGDPQVLRFAVFGVENAVELRDYQFSILAQDLIGRGKELQAKLALQSAQQVKCNEDQEGRESSGYIQTCPSRHSNRCHHEQRSCRGKTADRAAGVKDRPGSDESNPGNNLCRDSRLVCGNSGDLFGQKRKHRRSKTDEHVGAQSSGLMAKLPFQPDDPAQDSCHDEVQQGRRKHDLHVTPEVVHHVAYGFHSGADSIIAFPPSSRL